MSNKDDRLSELISKSCELYENPDENRVQIREIQAEISILLEASIKEQEEKQLKNDVKLTDLEKLQVLSQALKASKLIEKSINESLKSCKN